MKKIVICLIIALVAAGCQESRQAKVDKLLRQTPVTANGYFERAMSFKELGEPFHAIADLDRAIQLNPSLIKAYIERADMHIMQDSDEKALGDIARVTQLDPNNPQPHVLAAIIRIKQGLYKSAVEELNIAIEKDPAFAQSYAWKGLVYQINENLNRAIQLYNQFLTLDQSSSLAARVNFNLGRIYFSQQKWDKCEFHWRETQRIERRPNLDNWIALVEKAKSEGGQPSEIPSELQRSPVLR